MPTDGQQTKFVDTLNRTPLHYLAASQAQIDLATF